MDENWKTISYMLHNTLAHMSVTHSAYLPGALSYTLQPQCGPV